MDSAEHAELEEASRVSGGSWLTTFFRITLPLLRTGFLAGMLYISVVIVKELSVAILLFGPRSHVFATAIFEFWELGLSGAVAAYGTVMTLVLGIIVLVYVRLGGLEKRTQ